MRKNQTSAAIVPAAAGPAEVEVMDSGNPRWDRARKLRDEVKQAFLRSVDAQVLLGGELLTLKDELGFSARGGDRKSNVHRVRLIESRSTWDEWCQAELGLSRITADRFINCFKLIRDRARKLGDESQASRLLGAPAYELATADYKVVSQVLRELIGEQSQTELLREFNMLRRVNYQGRDTSGSSKAGNRSKDMPADFQWHNLYVDILAKLDELARNASHPNLDALMPIQPLVMEGESEGLILSRDKLAEAIEVTKRELDGLLAKLNRWIKAKEKAEEVVVTVYKRTGRLPDSKRLPDLTK